MIAIVKTAGKAGPQFAGRALLKRIAHSAVFPAVEALNVAVFRVVGRLSRPHARRLEFSGNDRVLVIAPHPDDETLGCGGTLARHADAGDRVCVAIVTDGGRSRARGLDNATMVTVRREEARKAVSALTVDERHGNPIDLRQLGLPEGLWREEELVEHVAALLMELRPTIIYATSRVDFHPEHLRVATVVARALESCADLHLSHVRVYELQVPLTPMLGNAMASIGYQEHRKVAALECYQTQSGSFLWVSRHRQYLRALYSREPLELFWEMTARQYIKLHTGEATPTASRFRSIRLRPFTDLMAWVVGWRERRALRRMVS